MDKIRLINAILNDFFSQNLDVQVVAAKDMMPLFIRNGVFAADHKNGLPIRRILRQLDAEGNLGKIPYVLAERKLVYTTWFFSKDVLGDQSKTILSPKVGSIKKRRDRKGSDEYYVLDLCDQVLGLVGSRQHYFDFLKGDSGRMLPVDIYYQEKHLAIEFAEKQHTQSVKFFDKTDVLTVSGVHRGEQRKIYDQRKKDVLPGKGIFLLEISYANFSFSSAKKIIREPSTDILIIERLLSKFKK